ncbi:hypothetical protein LIER_34440 [Lithospermum erythrorhizon]|uniref:Uncharacterized protein n=1 Tax=Lithospermum erythrorhizon TaxID=34254 RepID=A0AAV3S368_LITER
MTMPEIENVERTVAHGPPKIIDLDWRGNLCLAFLGGSFLAPAIPHQRERAKALLNFVDGLPASKLNSLMRDKLYRLFTPEGLIHVHGSVLGAIMCGMGMTSYIHVHDALVEKRGVQDVHSHFAALGIGLTSFGLLYHKGPFPIRMATSLKMAIVVGAIGAISFDLIEMMTGGRGQSPIALSIQKQGKGSD